MSLQKQPWSDASIVFYDGGCMLCARTVRLLLRADRHHVLHFAPLNGLTAKQLAINNTTDTAESVVFYQAGKIYQASTAVLAICTTLPFPWPILYMFIAVPPFIRNSIYRYIGRNRYRWFGQSTCLVVDPKFKDRILS